MDYGYQLLRHTIAQVFGNLGSAARITLVLLAIPLGIILVTFPEVFTVGFAELNTPARQADVTGTQLLGLLAAVIAGVICWLWAAVAWHRFVLLEEYPTGLFPNWRGSNIANYLGNAILIGLVLIAAGIAAGILIAILIAAIQSVALAVVLGVGLVFAMSWIATRAGLILPASAVGERLSISESWKATAPVSGQIILPIIVIAIASTILNQAIAAAFGTAVPTAPGLPPQVVLSMPGVLLSIAVGWIQMLVNLALMTTLYGNLIEGRQLN